MSVAPSHPGGRTAEGLPWPEGDPGGLNAAAGRMAAASARVGQTIAALGAAIGGVGGWQGAAAGAFRSAVQADQALLEQAVGALDAAAGQLRALADRVEEAQERVRELDRRVREAEEEAERAEARAALAAVAADAAGVALALAGSDPPAGLQSAADDAAAASRSAQGAAGDARTHAADVRRRAMREAEELCDDVAAADARTASAVEDAATAAPSWGTPGGPASPALTFSQRAFAAVPVEAWRAFAYHRAGIDGDAWNPALGFEANRRHIDASYAYYGELFRANRDFQWAGMANLVAPIFYAGFQDLAMLRGGGEAADEFTEEVMKRVFGDLPGPADDAAREALPTTPDLLASEAGWYERRFVDMQKQIFDDLVWQHEAYTIGGVALMRGLGARGTLPPEAARAWERIGAGDVAGGNRELLRREQYTVIQDDYEEMRAHHGPVGEAMTRTLTWVGDSPVEGGRPYRELYNTTIHVPMPVHDPVVPFAGPIDLPVLPEPPKIQIPEGNIADFGDRWRWIDQDMLPAYQRLLEQPGAVESTIAEPVHERAEEERILRRALPG